MITVMIDNAHECHDNNVDDDWSSYYSISFINSFRYRYSSHCNTDISNLMNMLRFLLP